MHTKDRLAQALREAGLREMAAKAEKGQYDDFLSPNIQPIMDLVDELQAVGTPAAMELYRQAMAGEFDATQEEADEWARSEEGQQYGKMLGPR